jgi:hypothetical protein
MNSEKNPHEKPDPKGRHRRRATRFSVSDRDDCFVFIDSKAYLINDLGLSSIGLMLLPAEALAIGEVIGDVLSGCRLNIAGQSIQGLDYRIVHISPGRGDYMLCGMEWVNKDSEKENLIKSIIENLEAEEAQRASE